MTVLEWSDALSLDLPLMDDTHREFVDLLAQAVQADDARLLPAWNALIDHTQDHFDREDRWMTDTRFSSSNCHTTQHKVVLAVMREGAKRGANGDLALVRELARELGLWFPQHAQSMDAALALHVRRVGYDSLTGQVTMPEALPHDEIQGCGGACGPVHTVGDAVAA
jgi:hemerythrin-like metal-binding protein